MTDVVILVNAHLMDEEAWDLGVLEAKVAFAKVDYLRAADRKRRDPLTAQRTWAVYAKLLHRLRLFKRSLNHERS